MRLFNKKSESKVWLSNKANPTISHIEELSNFEEYGYANVMLEENEWNWIQLVDYKPENIYIYYVSIKSEIFVFVDNDRRTELLVDIFKQFFEGNKESLINLYGFAPYLEVFPLRHASEEEYNDWKTHYQYKKKRDRWKSIGFKLLKLFTIYLILHILYLWYIGDLKFTFRETAKTKGTVTKVQFYHAGKGYYKQFVEYSYEIDDSVYMDYFRADKRYGIQEEGAKLEIRYAIHAPEINEVTGFYKEQKIESKSYGFHSKENQDTLKK
jgi:hypothetical protein